MNFDPSVKIAPSHFTQLDHTAQGRVKMNILEIACDESGAEGENLTGSHHRIFAHGSVLIDTHKADELIREIRTKTETKAKELKSEHVLNSKNKDTVNWLLKELADQGHIYLIDKQYFIVAKVVDLLVEELTHERGEDLYTSGKAKRMAHDLFTAGPRALGDQWPVLLDSFNSLMRATQRRGMKATVDEFYTVVDRARRRSHRRNVSEALDLIVEARPHAEEFQLSLAGSKESLPALDPLVPAITQTARYWYDLKHQPIRIIHDEQAALTEPRIQATLDNLRQPIEEFRYLHPGIRITGIAQVKSNKDSRVQLADILAGIGRNIANEALFGRSAEQVSSIVAFVDRHSIWSDEASWGALTG